MQTFLGPLQALLTATAASFVFDLGISLARGWSPEGGYIALCAALSFGVAALLGLLTSPTRRPEIALSVWLGLNVYLSTLLYVIPDWRTVIGFTAVCWLCLLVNDRRRESPTSLGLAVGLGLGFCATILPRLFGVLGIPRPAGEVYSATALAVLATILLAHAGYVRLRRRLSWLPRDIAVSIAVLIGMIVAVPMALTGPPTQDTVALRADSPGRSGSAPSKVVILIVLDTVRADHLSLYGYAQDTSPALRSFVETHERAVVYPLAFSPSNWTLPAHASLLTGLLPSDHGAHSGNLLDLRHALASDFQLQAEVTLAEVMKQQGFQTGAILANAQVMFFNGMDRGFDQIVRPQARGWLSLTGETLRRTLMPGNYAHALKPYPPAQTISREVLRFLDHCGPEPCFILANYMEAHWPFAAAAPYRGEFNKEGWPGVEVARYDEELLGLDAAIGELLEQLEGRGVLDRAWIVISADHGEEFWEHGSYMHGTSLYNTQVRIPLIIHPPSGERVRAHDGAVGLLDVTATLTAAVGARPLGGGRDLRGVIADAPLGIEWYGRPSARPDQRQRARAVVMGQAKLIERGDTRELYRLDWDSAERHDRAQAVPEEVERLARELPPLRVVPGRQASDPRQLPFDEIERLKALGYAD